MNLLKETTLIDKATESKLVKLAQDARVNSYAPYSHYRVGAAVLAESGKVYTGVNVENSSYGLSVCAERVAIWKAISEGERRIIAVAVATENGGTPCGACRQVMSEFGSGDMPVLVADAAGLRQRFGLNELLPEAFSGSDLVSE
jgi:cytidine deaminase